VKPAPRRKTPHRVKKSLTTTENGAPRRKKRASRSKNAAPRQKTPHRDICKPFGVICKLFGDALQSVPSYMQVGRRQLQIVSRLCPENA